MSLDVVPIAGGWGSTLYVNEILKARQESKVCVRYSMRLVTDAQAWILGLCEGVSILARKKVYMKLFGD